jgi:hypothetical protein
MATEPNKAEVLYKILHSASKLSGGNYRDRLAELLRLNKDSNAELIEALGLLHRTLTEVGQELERVDGRGNAHHAIFLEIEPSLRRALTPDSWWGTWDAQRQHIREGDVMALRSFGAVFSRNHAADTIPDAELAKIGEMVNELEAAILECPIVIELKSQLVCEIANIRHALWEYRIRGVESLRGVLLQNVGVVAVHTKSFEAAKDSKITDAYFKVLRAINTAVSTAERLKSLAGPVIKFLGGDSQLGS